MRHSVAFALLSFASLSGLAALVVQASEPSGEDPVADAAIVLPEEAAEAVAAYRALDHASVARPQRGTAATAGWRERQRAEWELSSLPSTHAGLVAELLADESPHVRRLGARALGLIGREAATPVLIEALAGEKNDGARVALVEALGRSAGEGALAAIEAQQKPGANKSVLYAIGQARRQLKGGAWDLDSIRSEFAEARSVTPAETVPARQTKAPELGLPSPDGPVNLSTRAERVVVLVFTHGDRQTHASRFLQRLASKKKQLDEWGVDVIVVDPHEKERTDGWKSRLRLPFTFCSDPAGRAAAKYGLGSQLFVSGEWLPSPAWFVIDRYGDVAWEHVGTSPKDHPPLGNVLPILERVQNNEVIND